MGDINIKKVNYQKQSYNLIIFRFLAIHLIVILISIPFLMISEKLWLSVYFFLSPFFTIMFLNINIKKSILFISIFFYVIGLNLVLKITPTLAGPDEIDFYNIVLSYDTLKGFFNNIKEIIVYNPRYIRSSEIWFPLILIPFYNILNLKDPQSIIIVNSFIWIMSSLLLINIVQEKYRENFSGNLVYLYLILLLLSPSFLYWSSTFAKDIIALSLCVISSYFYLKKKYIFATLFFILATGIRIYAIGIIIIYYFLFKKNTKLLFITSLCSLLFLVLYTKSINSVLYLPITILYFFVSPNPFDYKNYGFLDTGTWTVYITPLTIEGLFYGGILASSFLLIFYKGYRIHLINIFLSLIRVC